MKKIPATTREMVERMYNGYCGHKDCTERPSGIHHKLSDTDVNCAMFPRFIQSPFNLIPLCAKHHSTNEQEHKIYPHEARVYEEWLEKQYEEKK